LRLQKGKDQILFPKVDCPFYMELLGHLGQFRNTFLFQFRKIHKNLSPIRINLKQERRTDRYRSGTNAVPLSKKHKVKTPKGFTLCSDGLFRPESSARDNFSLRK
jgi:hypothetical protein